jgi:hypothetical protein
MMKKYLVALLLGMITGVVLLVLLLYFNPLNNPKTLSPLSVSQNEVITLNYSAVAANSLVYTNDGESQVEPYPAKVLQLWEATIRRTNAMATVMKGSRNQPVAIGVKFSSDSESTDILNGRAIVDSVWHIYMPGRGSLFIHQNENYWNYLREVVIPAYWSSGDNWRGLWNGQVTAGPGALATARVIGGSGEFAGMVSVAVESLSAQAYSVDHGPVALDSVLVIEVTDPEAEVSEEP